MNDEEYMAEALKEAEIAMSEDEVPIGCIIVYEGQIIARTHNQKETLKKATGHAEILAINQASEYLDLWHLDGYYNVCNIRTMYDVYRGYYTKSYESFSDWYECQ